MSGGSMAQMFQAMLLGSLMSRTDGKKMGSMLANTSQKDLIFLKELIEAGRVVSVIERRYPLNQVPEAIRYLEEGHAKGKIGAVLNNWIDVHFRLYF